MNAIVECRDHRNKGPQLYIGCYAKGTWAGRMEKSQCHILEQHKFTLEIIGPVVHNRDSTEVRKLLNEYLARWKIESNLHILEIVTAVDRRRST